MCKQAETTVSCQSASPGWARRWVLDELGSMYSQVGDAGQDVQIVVSELVTNALHAECRSLSVALDGHHTYVRVATTDDAAGVPVAQNPEPYESSGRGLRVVEALSTGWGVEPGAGSKTVWADVPLEGNRGPTFMCGD
jgi:anti-sigma regulatory factor (Ser/Thr protein kinase)